MLLTIRSVWGGPRGSLGTPQPSNGTIRITTWTFDDWAVARALVAARNRGVSVQVMAAQTANGDHGAWHWLRKRLGSNLYRPGHPSTRDTYSFARQCRGSCRGYGGTAHAKYFLFDNVGSRHLRHVVVNTSMNLTSMAYQGQWNQAQVVHSDRGLPGLPGRLPADPPGAPGPPALPRGARSAASSTTSSRFRAPTGSMTR